MTPGLLITGHIVKDVDDASWTAGGGALYAAAQASRLGVDTAVVTAADADVQPASLVADVEWRVVSVARAIEFENRYADGHRNQRVLQTSTPLRLDDIPEAWRHAPLVLLTPVLSDIEDDVPRALHGYGGVLGIGAQGWLRHLEGRRVVPGPVEASPEWLCGDVVFLSIEDAVDAESAEVWRDVVPVVVLTRGREGYTVWDDMGRHDIAPAPGFEVDPTGAGDVFAAAYLVRYGETRDVLLSARFAAAAAAVSVEGRGIEAVGRREQIEARLAGQGATL